MARPIIVLDADGVLLDYHQAYAAAWQRAFGSFPAEKDAQAYWPMDRWEVQRLTGAPLRQFRECFDEQFWGSIPPMAGALQACEALVQAGYELACVSALPARFRSAREHNLRQLGFPIDTVYATQQVDGPRSPKADVLKHIAPVAFVDDYLPYLRGVDEGIHCALIMRGKNGSPNRGPDLRLAASQHQDLLGFSRWWGMAGLRLDSLVRSRRSNSINFADTRR